MPLIEAVRAQLPALKAVIVIGAAEAAGILSWQQFLDGATDRAAAAPIDPEELASITYTSGTTDRPKGVMLSHYTYAFAPRTRAQGLGWNERDRVLCLLPLFHVNALCHMCVGMLSVGGGLVLTEKFSASRFWDEVREHGITTSSLMRTIPQILLALPERRFIVAADPTLFAKKDPDLYRIWRRIPLDAPIDSVEAIRQLFKSRYVICPNFESYWPFFDTLEKDPNVRTLLAVKRWVFFDPGETSSSAAPSGAWPCTPWPSTMSSCP